ncbi:MAG: DUF4136 domain-containing protein [Weeksellaceae bacterium]|nr:DUF4136 domain-containing protein [Weeksellaceae bacterium]
MKNLFIITFLLLILSLLVSCSPTRVTTDYDRNVYFSQFKTFGFYANTEVTNLSQLDQRRVLEAISSELQKRGLQPNETNPQLLIDVQGSQQQTQRQNASIGLGGGSWGRRGGGGVNVGIPIRTTQLQKSIVIDIVQAQTEQLIWQGVIDQTTGTRADSEQKIQEAVSKVFKDFPPK